jgi:hypothetical protein
VSFGDLNEDLIPALGGFPAIRLLVRSHEQGDPVFVRAALAFLQEALPPYPYGELAFVQGPDRPVLGASARAGALAPIEPVLVSATPGQVVVHGLLEIGDSGTGSLERALASQFPHATDRGVVHALALHWWGRPAWADRDRWIAEAAAAFYRDRFVEEAWDEEVSGAWERVRRQALQLEVARADYAPLVGGAADAEVVGVGLLRALASRLGEQPVLRGLDQLLRGQSPTTEALRDALSLQAGVDLRDFFDAWVIAGLRPEVRGSYTIDRGELTLSIEADAPHARFQLPVGVIVGKKKEEVRLSWVDVVDGVGKATLPAKGEVRAVVIDPERWLPLRGERTLDRR